VVRFLGQQFPLSYEIVEIDAPRRVVLRAENKMVRSTDVIEVAPAEGGGARLTYSAALRPKGLSALMAPLVGLAFRRTGDRAIAGLRARLAT
jgi:carbon monoxide dehydrogenase subunit G